MSATTPHEQRLLAIARARDRLLADPHRPTGLAPLVERSWRRCLAQGLQPEATVVFEPVGLAAQRQAQERHHSLLRAARPVIDTLSRTMQQTHYFALLTDVQGIVIDVQGPVDRADPRAASIARVGVDLSENRVGTTAIGACLTDLEPIWLHRGEHFFQSNSVYSCAGAPIWGPHGGCVGMLDLTGVMVAEHPALKHLVTQAARSIENALTLACPYALLLRLNWPGQALGSDADGLLCLDEDGRVVGLNRAAVQLLDLTALHDHLHAEDLFALPWMQLFDLAQHPRDTQEMPLWSGLRLQLQAQRPTAPRVLVQPPLGQRVATAVTGGVPLKDLEAAMIRQAVDEAHGNVQAAAQALGISRATVYRKLARR